jgi:hypothetical protein
MTAGVFKRQFLALAVRLRRSQTQSFARTAHRQHVQPSMLGDFVKCLRVFCVGIDHRETRFADHLAEQSKLDV